MICADTHAVGIVLPEKTNFVNYNFIVRPTLQYFHDKFMMTAS